jgi:hypothetical protein
MNQTQENTIEFITLAPSVRTYTGTELQAGKTYMHDGSSSSSLKDRVITAVNIRYSSAIEGNGNLVGVDNKGGMWYENDHLKYGRFFEVQVNMTVTKPI